MKRLGDMSRTALVTGAAIVVASAASAHGGHGDHGSRHQGRHRDRPRHPERLASRARHPGSLAGLRQAQRQGHRFPARKPRASWRRGARGARGARGPEGPAPRATYEKQEAKIKPGGVETVKATCPDGFEPSGGGFLDASGRLKIVGSYPISSAADQKPGWIVSVGNPDAAEQTVTAYAVRARGRT